MAHAIFSSRGTSVGLQAIQLPLSGVEVNSGVSVSGNTFSVNALGQYYIDMFLQLGAGGGEPKGFYIALFDETAQQTVQSFDDTVNPISGGESIPFTFGFVVTDITHRYSFILGGAGAGKEVARTA